MKLISHRGNLFGPNPELENQPQYIKNVIQSGYDCEIDVRYIHGKYYLGHDFPQYIIDISFIVKILKHLTNLYK